MSKEEKLLRYKKEMKETQSLLDQEKGSLTTIYDSLCKELDIKKTTNQKKIETRAKTTIDILNKKHNTMSEELEELIEEIEEELLESEGDY